ALPILSRIPNSIFKCRYNRGNSQYQKQECIKEILFPKRDVNQQNSNQKSKSTGQNNSIFHLFYGNRSTLNGSIRTNSGFVISSFDSVSVIVGKFDKICNPNVVRIANEKINPSKKP